MFLRFSVSVNGGRHANLWVLSPQCLCKSSRSNCLCSSQGEGADINVYVGNLRLQRPPPGLRALLLPGSLLLDGNRLYIDSSASVILDFSHDSLSGDVQSQLTSLDLPTFSTLDLRDNEFIGSIPQPVASMCLSRQSFCQGLPPNGCSAFGPHARQSIVDIGQCIPCSGSQALTGSLLGVSFVAVVCALVIYVRLVERFPYFNSWIATSSIVLGHLQVLSFCGTLTAIQGSTAGSIARAIELFFGNLFAGVHPECLLPPRLPIVYVGIGSVVAIPLLGIALLGCLKCYRKSGFYQRAPSDSLEALMVLPLPMAPLGSSDDVPASISDVAAQASPSGVDHGGEEGVLEAHAAAARTAIALEKQESAIDAMEEKTVILYSLQLPVVSRLAIHFITVGSAFFIAVGALILIAELLFATKLYRHTLALGGELDCLGKPYTALSTTRLRVRLRYLVRRFRDTVPHYQFAIWTRQLLVATSATVLRSPSQSYQAAAPFVQGILVIVVLLTSLWYHRRTQPYTHHYQNQLETILLVHGAFFVGCGCLYRTSVGSSTSADRILSAVLLMPGVLVLDWLRYRCFHYAVIGPGRTARLRARLQQAVDELGGLPELLVAPDAGNRFITEPRCLRFGEPVDNVFGIEHFMHVAEEEVMAGMIEGGRAIEREIEAHGTEVDKECLRYLLHEEAGSSTKEFQHGLMRDRGPNGEVLSERQVDDGQGGKRGMRLADFVSHLSSRTAKLREAHVLALRLYSTAAFRSINGPLRDLERFERGEPHLLPVTVALLRAAVMKLRAVNANAPSSNAEEELWRGMADVRSPAEFLERGGNEVCPCEV